MVTAFLSVQFVSHSETSGVGVGVGVGRGGSSDSFLSSAAKAGFVLSKPGTRKKRKA